MLWDILWAAWKATACFFRFIPYTTILLRQRKITDLYATHQQICVFLVKILHEKGVVSYILSAFFLFFWWFEYNVITETGQIFWAQDWFQHSWCVNRLSCINPRKVCDPDQIQKLDKINQVHCRSLHTSFGHQIWKKQRPLNLSVCRQGLQWCWCSAVSISFFSSSLIKQSLIFLLGYLNAICLKSMANLFLQ